MIILNNLNINLWSRIGQLAMDFTDGLHDVVAERQWPKRL